CVGNCLGTGVPPVDDIKTAVGLALGVGDIADCAGIAGEDQVITVDDIIGAVDTILGTCAASTPTPTPTTTPTVEGAPTGTVTPTSAPGPIIFTIAGTGIPGLNG